MHYDEVRVQMMMMMMMKKKKSWRREKTTKEETQRPLRHHLHIDLEFPPLVIPFPLLPVPACPGTENQAPPFHPARP
jgi:hypothetical protein